MHPLQAKSDGGMANSIVWIAISSAPSIMSDNDDRVSHSSVMSGLASVHFPLSTIQVRQETPTRQLLILSLVDCRSAKWLQNVCVESVSQSVRE